MPNSDFIFEKGSAIQVGPAGENNFVFASGESVSDGGDSPFVFEAGTGLGGVSTEVEQVDYTFNFNDGSTVDATRGPVTDNQSIEDFWNFVTPNAIGDINAYISNGIITVFIYKDTLNDLLSLVVVSDGGGEMDTQVTGLGGQTLLVEDDPGATSADEYTLSGGTLTAHNQWSSNNTDGYALGTWGINANATVNVTVQEYTGVTELRVIDDDESAYTVNLNQCDSLTISF